MSNKDIKNSALNDMPIDEFRKHGHQFIDWIADYIDKIDEYPVFDKAPAVPLDWPPLPRISLSRAAVGTIRQ